MTQFDPYARLDQLRGMFENTQNKVQEMQTRLAEVQIEVEDEEGRLKAKVGSSGVIGLSIDPRAMRLGSEELAERLTALIRRGTEEVQTEIQRISSEAIADFRPPDLPENAGLD